MHSTRIRIVVGANSDEAIDTLRRLYQPILEQTFDPPSEFPRPAAYHLPPLMTTDPNSAEMIKYAANTFLALKISFINEIAGLCEEVEADVTEVARGIGLDARIGHRFLRAGLGWGGSCYPKDTAALLGSQRNLNTRCQSRKLRVALTSVNASVSLKSCEIHWERLKAKSIGILGLAFKPNTDDVREAPALDIIKELLAEGAIVRAHDPIAIANARAALSGLETPPTEHSGLETPPTENQTSNNGLCFTEDVYALAYDADALVLVTEWDLYHKLELRRLAKQMKTPILIDVVTCIRQRMRDLPVFTTSGSAERRGIRGYKPLHNMDAFKQPVPFG